MLNHSAVTWLHSKEKFSKEITTNITTNSICLALKKALIQYMLLSTMCVMHELYTWLQQTISHGKIVTYVLTRPGTDC